MGEVEPKKIFLGGELQMQTFWPGMDLNYLKKMEKINLWIHIEIGWYTTRTGTRKIEFVQEKTVCSISTRLLKL